MKIFTEQQKFTQSWLIVLVLISTLIPLGMITNDYLKNDGTMETTEFLLLALSMLSVLLLMFVLKLTTRIDEKGIVFRFTPFHFKPKFIAWQEIDKAYTRSYDPISEYGGWGIKGGLFWKKNKGVAYNVSGGKGLQLVLKNGKKILIGTQKPTAIDSVLKTYIQNDK